LSILSCRTSASLFQILVALTAQFLFYTVVAIVDVVDVVAYVFVIFVDGVVPIVVVVVAIVVGIVPVAVVVIMRIIFKDNLSEPDILLEFQIDQPSDTKRWPWQKKSAMDFGKGTFESRN